MNNKRAAVITAIIVVILCLCIAVICCCYTYYNEMMDRRFEEKQPPPSPYTMEDIQDSDAACLLDPNFELTTENLESVLQSYFSAPSRLSYTVHSSEKFTDMIDTEYVCDELERNAAFGNIFRGKATLDTDEHASIMIGKSGYFFRNQVGDIHICCDGVNTYIEMSHFAFLGKSFIIEEDLTKEIDDAIENVLPYSMEVFVIG